MGFAPFIARRILLDKDRQDRISRPVISIAVLAIVIGIAVMILTVGITRGFQREIRTKLAGAGSHLQIGSISQTDPKETPRLLISQPFYPWLDTVPGVAHIQVYATKPGIIETGSEIEGVIVKGVGADHDWDFLRSHLLAGEVLHVSDSLRSSSVLISHYIAGRLHIVLGDTITIYLVNGREDIRPRKFNVAGIYETGIEQVDHQLVFVDIGQLQRFSQWGLQAGIAVSDTIAERGLRIEGLAFGGDDIFRYEWPGSTLRGKGPHWICTDQDTTITLVVHDADKTVPDTAWLDIHPHSAPQGQCATFSGLTYTERSSGGSHRYYCGGFEVALDHFQDLDRLDEEIYRDHLDISLRCISIRDRYPEIFAWLELLDMNVIVVIVLMVIVAMINMTSGLLIIILERTTMIGVLKALGAANGAIQRIFLIDAAWILGAGIVLGDLLGVGLALLQRHFGLVRLPIDTYYVDVVPVDLMPGPILLINIGTLAVCLLALLIPSMLVARIAPARAIRFE